MNIGIDGNEANTIERVGTGQYAYNLLLHWSKLSSHDFHIYLRRPPVADLPQESTNWHYHVIGPNIAWTRFALPLALSLSRKHEVFWNPAHYLPPYTFGKSVVTIHDLAYEYYPELFVPRDLYKLQKWTRASVKHATKVIAVSEATKRDLVRKYRVPAGKVVVVNNGYDAKLFNTKIKRGVDKLKNYGLSEHNYILFVGTLQPRKNVGNLVRSFSILKSSGYKGKLVIAGKIGWMAEDTLKAIQNSTHHQDIVVTGYITDETRQILYRGAEILVLPSLYEGFGVPLVEAMACGTPVAGSNNSSLPEVIGQGGELFDESSPEDIARSIKQVIAKRASYAQAALAQAAKFSWEKCARETLKVLVEVQ